MTEEERWENLLIHAKDREKYFHIWIIKSVFDSFQFKRKWCYQCHRMVFAYEVYQWNMCNMYFAVLEHIFHYWNRSLMDVIEIVWGLWLKFTIHQYVSIFPWVSVVLKDFILQGSCFNIPFKYNMIDCSYQLRFAQIWFFNSYWMLSSS